MISELNQAMGEVVANCAPEHHRKEEKAIIKISSTGLREQSVYARGQMDKMERLLAVYFGGVP